MAKKNKETLTTARGALVADNQNSLTAGARGPLLVQDWQLFEKHAHFNRERIPNASFTPRAPPLTAPSPSPTILRSIPKPIGRW